MNGNVAESRGRGNKLDSTGKKHCDKKRIYDTKIKINK